MNSGQASSKKNMIIIGEVVGVHGIKGELKVALFYPDINFENIKKVRLAERTFFIETFRYHKKSLLLKLQEISDRTTAETFGQQQLSVEENFLNKEVIIKANVVDQKVYDQTNNLVGVVDSLITTPAHDVLVIHNSTGKELLVPWVEKFVLEVSDDKIIVDLTDLAEA